MEACGLCWGSPRESCFFLVRGLESRSYLWAWVEIWPSDYPKHHIILFSLWGLIRLALFLITWPGGSPTPAKVWCIKKPVWGVGRADYRLFLSEGPSGAACRASGPCHCWAWSLFLVLIQRNIVSRLLPSLILSDTDIMISLGTSYSFPEAWSLLPCVCLLTFITKLLINKAKTKPSVAMESLACCWSDSPIKMSLGLSLAP